MIIFSVGMPHATWPMAPIQAQFLVHLWQLGRFRSRCPTPKLNRHAWLPMKLKNPLLLLFSSPSSMHGRLIKLEVLGQPASSLYLPRAIYICIQSHTVSRANYAIAAHSERHNYMHISSQSSRSLLLHFCNVCDLLLTAAS